MRLQCAPLSTGEVQIFPQNHVLRRSDRHTSRSPVKVNRQTNKLPGMQCLQTQRTVLTD